MNLLVDEANPLVHETLIRTESRGHASTAKSVVRLEEGGTGHEDQ